VKQEKKQLNKQKAQLDKDILTVNQLKHGLIKKQHDQAKQKQEEIIMKRKETLERAKTIALLKEARQIKRKEVKSKRLEMQESSILSRLKETHGKQQEAI